MKIVHFNTYSIGGAAIAANRLHIHLCNKGFDSTIVYLYKNKSATKNSVDFRDSLSPLKKLILKIKNKVLNRSQNKYLKSFGNPPELFSFPETVWEITNHPEFIKADIVHFHWVANFLNYSSISSNAFQNKKVFWTLHDIHPITGGFHYTNWFDVMAWQNISIKNLSLIKLAAAESNISIIAPSTWIKSESEKSGVFGGNKHYHIQNPCSNTFKYFNKTEARKQLGLNNDRICFIPAENINYARKGLKKLASFIKEKNHNITFIVSGNEVLDLGENKQIQLGCITHENTMHQYFAAADFVAFPSLDENFSNVLVESVLSGCPVICFNVGGNSEIIRDISFGNIIPYLDWKSFINSFCNLDFTDEQRENLAECAKAEFSIEKTTESIINVYSN